MEEAASLVRAFTRHLLGNSKADEEGCDGGAEGGGGYVRNDYPFGAVSVPIAPPVANKFWGGEALDVCRERWG